MRLGSGSVSLGDLISRMAGIDLHGFDGVVGFVGCRDLQPSYVVSVSSSVSVMSSCTCLDKREAMMTHGRRS